MHEELLKELSVQKENLRGIKFAESQSKALCMVGYALLLHYVLKHIPDCGTRLAKRSKPEDA